MMRSRHHGMATLIEIVVKLQSKICKVIALLQLSS